MEWGIAAFVAVMFGLYVWSHVTTQKAISNRVQPFVDDLFGSHPRQDQSQEDDNTK
jgi:hypothetical protein